MIINVYFIYFCINNAIVIYANCSFYHSLKGYVGFPAFRIGLTISHT